MKEYRDGHLNELQRTNEIQMTEVTWLTKKKKKKKTLH